MPITTTLKQRQKPVTAEDFKSAGIKLYPTEHAHEDAVISMWNEHINYTPAQLRNLFADQYDNGIALTIKCTREHSIDFVLSDEFFKFDDDPESNNADHLSYQWQRYELPSKELSESHTRIAKDKRGKGIGSDLASRFVDIDIALGNTTARFEASLESGGYAWAKAGYYVDRSDGEKLQKSRLVAQDILRSLECIKDFIPSAVYNKARVHAQISNPDDLYLLTQIDTDLSEHINPEKLGLGGEVYLNFYPHNTDQGTAHTEATKMRNAAEFCRRNGKPLTIGHLLLSGRHWDAYANYNDRKQLERLEQGGIKLSTSKFVNDATPDLNHEGKPSI